MNKETLKNFITKYNLSGVDSVKWETDGQSLAVRFSTNDHNLGGDIRTDLLFLDSGEYGIYDASALVSQLGILGDDISITIVKSGKRNTALRFTDGTYKAQFMLADLSIIPIVPKKFNIPSMDVTLRMDAEFVQKFVKAKNALPDAETFTVFSDGKDARIVIGHDNKINSNTIELPIENPKGSAPDGVVFQATLMKEILLANKECGGLVFKYSVAGIAVLDFDVEGFELDYYMVAVQ